MTVKYTDPCNMANQDCEAPAGRGGSFGHYTNDYSRGNGARFNCYSCGLPVCGKCSKVVKYMSFGRQRICDNCREEQARK
jgi:hypothetical protein